MDIYIICGAVLVILMVICYIDRKTKAAQRGNDTPTENVSHATASGECCGKHAVCEKQKLAEARMRAAQYFDDEELDLFRGRASDSYDDSEIEEFRYVMYTMSQDEVREWMECLQAREVELPDQLKEEAWAMINGI